jgi:multidrug efflux system outer membrane protein
MLKIRRDIFIRISILFILFTSAGLFAQDGGVITLEDAIDRAVERSLALRKSALDLEDAAYAKKHTWAEFLPSVSLGAGLSYGSNLFTEGGFKTENAFGYNFSAGVNLSLNAGVPFSIRLIALAYESDLITYEDTRRQIGIQTAKAFYSLIAERRNLSLLEEKLSLAERQRERSRAAFRNGLVSERTDAQAALAVETARLDLISAQIQCEKNERSFFTMIGLESTEGVGLEGEILVKEIAPDPDALIRDFLPQRPDIIRQRQTIERLTLEKKRQTFAGKAPSVGAGLRWNGTGGRNFSDNLSGSLSVTIPIDSFIPGSKTAQNLRSADTELAKARLDLEDAETAAKNEIRNLCAALKTLRETITIARLRSDSAERAYRLTEQAFSQGAAELLTLEDARNALTEARQQVLSAELAYLLGVLDLEAAVNTDIEPAGNEEE